MPLRRNTMQPRKDYHLKRMLRTTLKEPTKCLRMSTRSQVACKVKLIRKYVSKRKPSSRSPRNSSSLELSKPTLSVTSQELFLQVVIYKQISSSLSKNSNASKNFFTTLNSRSSKWRERFPEQAVREVRRKPNDCNKRFWRSRKNLTARRSPSRSYLSPTSSLRMSAETLSAPLTRSETNVAPLPVRSKSSNLRMRWPMVIQRKS